MPATTLGSYDALLLHSDVGLVEVVDRHIVWANSSMHRMFGYEPDELIGKPTRLFFADSSSYEEFGRELQDAVSTSGRHRCITSQVRKDGSTGWFEFHISRVEGEPDRLVGAIVDRNDTRDLVAQLNSLDVRYRSVVEDQTEVISRVRPDGTFVFVNAVYCRLFGRTQQELIGRRWQPIAHPDDLPMIEARLREMTPDSPVVVIENRVFVASGELRWMQFVNRGFYGADGQLAEIQAVGRDITRLKQVETNLRESQAMLERAQAVARIGSFSLGSDHDCFEVTPEAARLFDLGERRTMTHAEWLSRVHMDDRSAVASAWNASLQGAPFDMTYRIDAMGDVHWIHAIAEFRFDERGGLLGGVGTVQDITEKTRVELALRDSEERVRHAMEAARAGSWELIPETGQVLADERTLSIHGLEPGAMITYEGGMSIVLPADREKSSAAVQHALATGEALRIEHRIQGPEGGVRWVEAYAERQCKNGRFVLSGFVRDITDRKSTEERLAESKRQLELALWGADIGTWDTDLASRRCTFDARCCAMLGRQPEEIEPNIDAWRALIHPEDLPRVDGAISAHEAGATAVLEVEHRLRHKNGHWAWVLVRGRVIRDAEGRSVRASGTMLDISERKRVTVEGLDLLGRIQRLIAEMDAPLARRAVPQSSATSDRVRLSGRNREILQLIAEGRTTAQIADQLCISESTAKTHRRNLMRKLGLATKADLIRYAIRQGIVES